MVRRDWVLLAIAAAEGEALSPVQLQKCMFLIGENCKSAVGKRFYKFVPFNYGPFNPTIYDDAQELEAEGLIRIGQKQGQRWVQYSATPKGINRARELEKDLSEEVLNYLHLVVDWARRQTFQKLVNTIYKHYPQYRKNSVFQQ